LAVAGGFGGCCCAASGAGKSPVSCLHVASLHSAHARYAVLTAGLLLLLPLQLSAQVAMCCCHVSGHVTMTAEIACRPRTGRAVVASSACHCSSGCIFVLHVATRYCLSCMAHHVGWVPLQYIKGCCSLVRVGVAKSSVLLAAALI
jgi:hypothetical protein